MSSKICNFYNCDNTSVNNWIIFISVFSSVFLVCLFFKFYWLAGGYILGNFVVFILCLCSINLLKTKNPNKSGHKTPRTMAAMSIFGFVIVFIISAIQHFIQHFS